MKKYLYNAAASVSTMLLMAKSAHAGDGANRAMQTVTEASNQIPSFMMMGAYIMGIGFAITGLLKIKDAVENPGKESVKDGLFRLLIGGGLLALGSVLQYMVDTASVEMEVYEFRDLNELTLD